MPDRSARWSQQLREFVGNLHREARVALTPVVAPGKWLFVVGCYNSGTELLMKLLGAHPEIAALPVEGQFLTRQFLPDYELGVPRMWVLREDLFRLTEQDRGPDVNRLKRDWLMRLDRQKRVYLEKSPPNAARTRWLQQHFENAHFLAVVRNGYAVAEGIRRKAEPHHLPGGWPLELCARQWARSNEVLLEDAAHLRRVHWLRYEDFARDPYGQTRRILDFLELDGGIDVERTWTVHERAEPIRDMNQDSIGRLTDAERGIVTREAQHMLRHFGYDVLA